MVTPFNQILIIDDNDIDAFILERIIDRSAFCGEVISKHWAQEAIDFLQENDHIHGKIPSLIFLDINMPVMNGFEFLEAFAQLSDAVKLRSKVVMISTSNHLQDRQKALNNPYVHDYLVKPADPALVDKVMQEVDMIIPSPVYRSREC